MQHYHYIFTGSGLSALMTVYNFILSGKFNDKTILLIDENQKKTNDRTWCFWGKSSHLDHLVYKKWNIALFADENFQRDLVLKPSDYKMIKGLDFYNHVFETISKQKNIHFLNENVADFEELGNHCVVKTKTKSFTCNSVFNSIYNPDLANNHPKFPLLHQHFVGWFIKTKESVFDEKKVTVMDFSIKQKGNTRFMYVLPTSSTEALFEYTLFSKELLSKQEYESEIHNYIENLGIIDYEIVEKEQGNIPMTCYPFWKHNTKNIIHIGSAGGWTKASTGYTFKNATKKSKALVKFLEKNSDFTKFHTNGKFWYYDLLFLDVLSQRNDLGSTVFSALFKKGNPELIFKFLDEETSFFEEIKVMWKCPKKIFLSALCKRIFSL